MENDLIPPTEAAEILNVSRQTITRWCREGVLKAQKVGKGWVISRRSIEEFEARNRPSGAEREESK